MITFRAKDHPEANGRQPQEGDTQWAVRFPLEGGQELVVLMGQEGFDNLKSVLMDQIIDQANDPEYSKPEGH